jgi:hypothetical protein
MFKFEIPRLNTSIIADGRIYHPDSFCPPSAEAIRKYQQECEKKVHAMLIAKLCSPMGRCKREIIVSDVEPIGLTEMYP